MFILYLLNLISVIDYYVYGFKYLSIINVRFPERPIIHRLEFMKTTHVIRERYCSFKYFDVIEMYTNYLINTITLKKNVQQFHSHAFRFIEILLHFI